MVYCKAHMETLSPKLIKHLVNPTPVLMPMHALSGQHKIGNACPNHRQSIHADILHESLLLTDLMMALRAK